MENHRLWGVRAPVLRRCPGAHLAPSKTDFDPSATHLNFWPRSPKWGM
jgi:hypothetical protein